MCDAFCLISQFISLMHKNMFIVFYSLPSLRLFVFAQHDDFELLIRNSNGSRILFIYPTLWTLESGRRWKTWRRNFGNLNNVRNVHEHDSIRSNKMRSRQSQKIDSSPPKFFTFWVAVYIQQKKQWKRSSKIDNTETKWIVKHQKDLLVFVWILKTNKKKQGTCENQAKEILPNKKLLLVVDSPRHDCRSCGFIEKRTYVRKIVK